MRYFYIHIVIISFLISCNSSSLEEEIIYKFENFEGDFALAYKDLSSGNQILYNEKQIFHAASTMKTPLMIEVFNQVNKNNFNLSLNNYLLNLLSYLIHHYLYCKYIQGQPVIELKI